MAEPLNWPINVYLVMTVICLPLYILVWVCLVRLRYHSKTYRSTFYTILLQHCIADIISMIFFTFIWALRKLPGLRQFYFEYQDFYIAAATYNSIYYLLYIRCCGIVLLSLHRCLVISAATSLFAHKVQEVPIWVITVTYWTLPTLLSIVVLKDTNFYYDGFETMEIVAEREVIMRNTLMALIVVSLTCFICTISYTSVFYYLRKHTGGMSRSLKREIHLALQVLALVSAFFLMFAYYAFQNYFARTQNAGPIYLMRSLYPIANGILSYINPFCILLLNHDFGTQFKSTLTCKEVKVSDVQISTRKQSTPSLSHSIHAFTSVN